MYDVLTTLKAIQIGAPNLDHAMALRWAEAFVEPMDQTGINNVQRIAGMIGQVCEESGGLTREIEDLTYLSTDRLMTTFKGHFNTPNAALPYVRQPEKLANFVYGNRMGNGPFSSGDGWLYRGRGPMQITGLGNYRALASYYGKTVEDTLDWILRPEGGAASACWFFSLYTRLNEVADRWDLTTMTKVLNGGLINLATRERICNDIRVALSQTS